MEPINLDNILKGDIERELARVQSAIKGVGDESYTSFKRLLNSSNEAFNGLSRNAQAQVRLLQDVIQELRQNEVAQEALFNKLKKGELSSRDYADAQGELSVRQAELKQQASQLNNEIKEEILLNREALKALREKTSILAMLREEYSRLNSVELQNEEIGGQLLSRIQALSNETRTLREGLEGTKSSSESLLVTTSQLPGSIEGTVSQFKQLYSVCKTLMSAGLGAFITSLAGAFYVLKIAIEGSEEGTSKLNSKLEYTKSQFNSYRRMLTQGGAFFSNLFSGDFDAMKENYVDLREVHFNQGQYADSAEKAAIKQGEINNLIERNSVKIKENTLLIEQYRVQMADVNRTLEDRLSISQKVINLEQENAKLKFDPLAQNYDNFKDSAKDGYTKVTRKYPNQLKLVETSFNTLTQGGELTSDERSNTRNAILDITQGLDDGWDDDVKKQFSSFFEEALRLSENYHSKVRQATVGLNEFARQQGTITVQTNHETALEALQEEVRFYKEQYDILGGYERNMGKESADKAFGELKANGNDFLGYLSGKINELQNKPNRTKDDNINLGYLQKTYEEATPKYDSTEFRNAINEKKELYQEDIEGYLKYLQELRTLMEQDTSNVGTQKRIILDVEIKGAKGEQQKNLDELVKNYQSYFTKMKSLDDDYQRDKKRLEKGIEDTPDTEEKKRYQETLNARTDVYQADQGKLQADNAGFTNVLFGNIKDISRTALKEAINEAKAFIEQWKQKSGAGTPETNDFVKQIEEGIDNAEKKSKSDLPQDLQASAAALQDCADMASLFDSGLSDVLDNAASLAQSAASVATGFAQMASGNYVQGAASILSGVSSFITGIGKRVQENEKVRKEYLQGLVETFSKELEYNSILRERLRIQQQIGETALSYSSRLGNELKLQQAAINTEYQEVWGKLMGEEYISGTGYKHGTWFRKAKTWNEYDSLSGKTYEEIESLYTQDKLEGSAKTLFERLRQLKEEGADVVEMMDNLKLEMQEAWTGTTASAITDSIVQGLLDGKKGAADFADDFRNLMQTAMMQSIKMKYLEAPLQEWYARFAKDSESGLTADKIEELRRQYDAIIQSAANEAEALEKVTGVSLSQDAARTAAAQGIQSVSQDSFDAFMGSVNALQYITYNIDKNITSIQSILYQAAAKWVAIEENTRYCRKLEGMEIDLREMKNGISTMVNSGILMRTR